MGRLYQNDLTGDLELAFFQDGEVHLAGDKASAPIYYDSAGCVFTLNALREKEILAVCDNEGSVRRGSSGPVIASCIDGQILGGNHSDNVLACYDGDMYGAAAAAIATVLKKGAGTGATQWLDGLHRVTNLIRFSKKDERR